MRLLLLLAAPSPSRWFPTPTTSFSSPLAPSLPLSIHAARATVDGAHGRRGAAAAALLLLLPLACPPVSLSSLLAPSLSPDAAEATTASERERDDAAAPAILLQPPIVSAEQGLSAWLPPRYCLLPLLRVWCRATGDPSCMLLLDRRLHGCSGTSSKGELSESLYIGPIHDGDTHNDVDHWPSEGELSESLYIGPIHDGDTHNDVDQWPSEGDQQCFGEDLPMPNAILKFLHPHIFPFATSMAKGLKYQPRQHDDFPFMMSCVHMNNGILITCGLFQKFPIEG